MRVEGPGGNRGSPSKIPIRSVICPFSHSYLTCNGTGLAPTLDCCSLADLGISLIPFHRLNLHHWSVDVRALTFARSRRSSSTCRRLTTVFKALSRTTALAVATVASAPTASADVLGRHQLRAPSHGGATAQGQESRTDFVHSDPVGPLKSWPPPWRTCIISSMTQPTRLCLPCAGPKPGLAHTVLRLVVTDR